MSFRTHTRALALSVALTFVGCGGSSDGRSAWQRARDGYRSAIHWLLGAPDLSLSVSGDAAPLLGANVKLRLVFDNISPADTGYFPVMRLVLPAELSYASSNTCNGLGTPSVTVDATTPGVDPYTGESVTLAAGEKLVIIKPNVGQLTPDQPAIDCELTLTATGQTPNVADQIRDLRAIFALGELTNGTPDACGGSGDTLCSAAQTFDVTPTFFRLDKQSNQGAPHVTGPTSPIGFTITGSLAAGQTLTNLTVTDTLPDSLVLEPLDPGDCSTFSITPAPTTCAFTPDPTPATAGSIALTYATLAGDMSLSYDAYVRDQDDAGGDVVSHASGDATTAMNDAAAANAAFAADLHDAVTVAHRSVHLVKGAVNSNDIGGAGNTPGDEITWTAHAQVSDYFQIGNLGYADTVGDGLTYLNGTLNLSVRENGTTVSCGEAALLAGGHLTVTPNVGTGQTAIVLDVDAALGDAVNCPGFTDDELWGDSFHGAGSTTQVTVAYRTDIDDDYTTVPPTGDVSIDADDTLTAAVTSLSYDILGGDAGKSATASASIDIKAITQFTNAISHVNASPVMGTQNIGADDLVTYKLTAVIPGGDAEDLAITDYLPRPLFEVSPCAMHDGADTIPPPVDAWSFGTNETGVAAGALTVSCNPTNNSISFAFPDFDVPGGASKTVEIYFTTTAKPEPITDGLLQTAVAQLTYNDSNSSAAATAVGTVALVGDAPLLEVTKAVTATSDAGGAIASGNLSGVDAHASVTFRVTVENTGMETAYDVALSDVLPAGLEAPSSPGSCSGATCDYDVTLSAGCADGGATPDALSATDEGQIAVTGMRIAPAGTCTIDFDLRVAAAAEYGATILNTARVTYASSLGGTSFSPKTDAASVTVAHPTVSIGQSDLTGTPGDTVMFRVGVTFPEGQGSNFRVIDVEGTDNHLDNATVVAVSGGISGSGPYCSVDHPSICFANDPTSASNWTTSNNQQFRINLGTATNTATDDVDREVAFDITVQVRGVASGTRTNRGRAQYGVDTNNLSTANSSTVNFTVVRPALAVSKCFDDGLGTAEPLTLAGTAGYRVMVRNTGSNLSTAYDVADVADTLPQGLRYGGGTVDAYYCSAGAASASCGGWTTGACTGTLTDVSTVVRAGETVEASPFGGNSRQEVAFPVRDASANPDIEANGYFVVEFAADVSCASAADTDGANATLGSHPDDDGYAGGCADPIMAYSGTVTNAASVATYTTQDGPFVGEQTLGPVASANVVTNLDLDGDGILNASEGSGDADGDGVPNYLDTDSDDNGVPDQTEGAADADSDGTPDYRDVDDDDDGIDDGAEIVYSGGAAVDTDGDTVPDYRDPDSDGDGLLDDDDGESDEDGDGAANYVDRDSDNDGIPDLIELGFAAHDSDGDGLLSAAEVLVSGLDGDGDGAISIAELGGSLPDADGDGIPNYLDLDSDDDGLTDTDEAGLSAFTGGDHRISAGESALIDDGAATDVSGGAFDDNGAVNADEIPDTDGDGTPDYLDPDSDGDGVRDLLESRRDACDADEDGVIDYPSEIAGCAAATDADGDGFLQLSEYASFDHDADLAPDHLDRDSDGDGIGDLIEAFAADQDGNADGRISEAEFTGFIGGIGDLDGVLVRTELRDTDSDGTPDLWDLDSDGDTVTDAQEAGAATPIYLTGNLYDTDATGAPDFRDLDSDGDGYSDATEAGDANVATAPVDTDMDLTPDVRDLDSDGDGLADADELTLTTGRTTIDTDGDGASDGCEVHGNTVGCPYDDAGNAGWYPGPGSAGAPITDPKDADTDDGGTNDFDEADTYNTDPRAGHGADDHFHVEDPDGDGLTNAQEATLMTDANAADTDGDGCRDGCEVLGTTLLCPYDDATNASWYPGPGSVGAPITDPLVTDTDGDACGDCFEATTLFSDPRAVDSDGDTLSDCQESDLGSNPNDVDSDDDGLPDDEEVALGTSPVDADTDGDGCADAAEVAASIDPLSDPDTDGDGLTDCREVGTHGTNPRAKDTDGGGIDDGVEVSTLRTDPLDPDDDCPNVRDTDGDGLTDCEELERGLDPLDGSDVAIQGSGTKGVFGLGGCRSTGGAFGWFAGLLMAAVALVAARKRGNHAR